MQNNICAAFLCDSEPTKFMCNNRYYCLKHVKLWLDNNRMDYTAVPSKRKIRLVRKAT